MLRVVCNRREWLRLSSLAGLGWLGQSGLAAESADSSAKGPGFGKAKSVILVFCNGGQSQLDIWDPKPEAPLDVRGAFRAISTAAAGLQFGEHVPKIAQVANLLTVVRCMSHEDLDHGSAAYLCLTGRYHLNRTSNPPPASSDAPTYGAVLRRLRRDNRFAMDAIHVNGPALVPREPGPGQNGGYLGRGYEPLVVGDATDASGAIPGLAPRRELPAVRLSERLTLKHSLDRAASVLEQDAAARDLAGIYAQAYELLASPRAREAFNLAAEPAAVRDRYGRNRSGQALLLARRLVEAGVPYINVIWNHSNRGQDDFPRDTDLYGWDTHNDIFHALQNHLLPRFDQSFSALLSDLDERGLLDETLVVCMGEFGRAPRVALEPNFAGATPGRKHWANVYSIVLAGAGVQRGAAVGASDRLGGEPASERCGPWDAAATMFHALGLEPSSHYTDPLGRPFALSVGRPMEAVYGA